MRALLCFVLLSVTGTAIAQPYSGTIFIDPDIISDSDPSTLVSVTPAGQGQKTVWDYRVNNWITINAFLYDVQWNDGLTSLGVVNPEFGSAAAGETEVTTYATALSKIPSCLRSGVHELWIHAGVASFGGGNNAIVIHTGRGQEYIADGILEEAFVHEGTHCSLDAMHAGSSGWMAAQNADPVFISTYAAGAPTTEDLAESVLPWLAVRHRADRISTTDYNTITSSIPNRLAYIDGIVCDLYPVTSQAGIADAPTAAATVSLVPNPASDWFEARSATAFPVNARLELFDATGRVMLSRSIRSGERMETATLGAGLYHWRCTQAGAALGQGALVIE